MQSDELAHLVKDCQFGVSPVNYSDSDLSKVNSVIAGACIPIVRVFSYVSVAFLYFDICH